MHLTRSEVSNRIPIPRKGTKYIVRTTGALIKSVPVLVAVRDMLKLAKTKKEVQQMINQKLLKLNGKEVKDNREPIYIFNIFTADKNYFLKFSKNGKFSFEETKEKNRPCKIIGKKILRGKKVQLNLHDGSNILYDKKVSVGDTLYLDSSGKITSHVPIEKGKKCFVRSGKYLGRDGVVEKVENGSISIKMEGVEKPHSLDKERIIVL